MYINIDDKIIDDINEYCELNKISNVEEFINKSIRDGFNSIKYGHRITIPKKTKLETNELVGKTTKDSIKNTNITKQNIYGENE